MGGSGSWHTGGHGMPYKPGGPEGADL